MFFRSAMFRRAWWLALGALAVLLSPALSGSASAAEVLKVGTLAPQESPWGQVFQVWAKAVKKKSDGKAELQFFYNGQQGDEGAMVGKMKAGQLDGAAVTAVGLSKIHQPVLALQMPGLATDWGTLDKIRTEMKSDLEKGIASGGFKILGWGDVGKAHVMSKGFAIRKPADFKGKKPYMWRDDTIQPVIYQVIGGVTPVPLNVPEVLPNLNSGAVNVINAPALAAEQLQWASRLDHVGDEVGGIAIGALVFTSKRIDALPGDLRTIVVETGEIAGKALTKRIRKEDDQAYERMKGKMKVVTLSGGEKAEWKKLFKEVRGRLGQGTFDPKLIKRLEGLAGL
jgi:TRAP-type transport system periplasmic protein